MVLVILLGRKFLVRYMYSYSYHFLTSYIKWPQKGVNKRAVSSGCSPYKGLCPYLSVARNVGLQLDETAFCLG